MRKKLIAKPALCVNCRMCEMACSLEKTGMFNPVKARIWIHRNKKGVDMPMICRHCTSAPCKGTLALLYFTDQKIRYTFEFTVDGETYRYVGEKVHIFPWNLPWSHTTCFGRLTKKETGELVSVSVVHFRYRTIPAFMASLRLA